jgi:hypothetical protein
MTSGYVTLLDETGARYEFGNPEASMKAKIEVLKSAFWLRVAVFDHLVGFINHVRLRLT